MTSLFNRLVISSHLLWIVTGQPIVHCYLMVYELYSLLTSYLYRLFAFVSTIKPCLCPTTDSLVVIVNGGGAFNIVALYVYLKVFQRIGGQSVF